MYLNWVIYLLIRVYIDKRKMNIKTYYEPGSQLTMYYGLRNELAIGLGLMNNG